MNNLRSLQKILFIINRANNVPSYFENELQVNVIHGVTMKQLSSSREAQSKYLAAVKVSTNNSHIVVKTAITFQYALQTMFYSSLRRETINKVASYATPSIYLFSSALLAIRRV